MRVPNCFNDIEHVLNKRTALVGEALGKQTYHLVFCLFFFFLSFSLSFLMVLGAGYRSSAWA